jgi:hypothetical protein
MNMILTKLLISFKLVKHLKEVEKGAFGVGH